MAQYCREPCSLTNMSIHNSEKIEVQLVLYKLVVIGVSHAFTTTNLSFSIAPQVAPDHWGHPRRRGSESRTTVTKGVSSSFKPQGGQRLLC